MSPGTDVRTIVVIPAFNEEESLPAVLAQLAEVVPDLDIVVVDDGSTDRTAAVTRIAGVPCVALPFNLGIGGALRAGYRYANDNGYDRAVQFDADGRSTAVQKWLSAADSRPVVMPLVEAEEWPWVYSALGLNG